MPRVSAYPMVQVGEALGTILAHAQPLGRETVELTRARGRILAQDVTADADLPGLPRSSVDGYAVMAGDDSAELEVLEEVTAGRLGSTHVRPGAAGRCSSAGPEPAKTSIRLAWTCRRGSWCWRAAPASAQPRSDCWQRSAASTYPCTDARAWRSWQPVTNWSSPTRRRRPGRCATAIGT